ncbi:MAG: AraC family transcriptional regulator [Dorea sp.]
MTNREDVRLYIKELDEEEKHAHREIEIDYILYGSAELVLSGDSFYMKKGDIILINSNKLHWWQRMKDCLVCRILISASMMEKMLGKHSVSFWCNSVTNSERDVDRLRIILNSLIKKYRAAGKRGSFSLECSKYLLLESLSENFLVETQETGNGIEDQRVQNAIGYINEHYAEHLSLVRIAETLYLSESYLSRLFKNIVGMNFREYLSRVRLNHAVESLLYTEKSITDISLECGFENPSSFNKLFKKIIIVRLRNIKEACGEKGKKKAKPMTE